MTPPRRSRYVGVFLLVMFGLLALFNASKPRVLILLKDTPQDAWIAQFSEGVKRALGDNRRPLSVSWHYLGLDQKTTPAARLLAFNEARQAISLIDPDIVVAVDDETNAWVARNLARGPRPKIVYASIDVPPATYGYDALSHVSGVAEVLPMSGVTDAVYMVRKGRPCRIAAVGADNETVRAETAQITAYPWAPCELVFTASSRTLNEFQANVERAGREADVLLVMSFDGLVDGDGKGVSDDVVAMWIEQHSRAFPLGLQQQYVTCGGGISFTPSGLAEGNAAMTMALEWIDRPRSSRAPTRVTSDAFEVMLREGAVRKRGVKVPSIYREAARAAGHLYP